MPPSRSWRGACALSGTAHPSPSFASSLRSKLRYPLPERGEGKEIEVLSFWTALSLSVTPGLTRGSAAFGWQKEAKPRIKSGATM